MSDNFVLEQTTTPPIKPRERLDPYPYGWREVQVTLPNGEQKWQRIPLTLADVLHPQEEDILMPTEEHERWRNYLYNALTALLIDHPDAVVLTDTNVAWDVDDIKPHRPDLAVIFNVRQLKNWGTFDVREEGTRPALIIEITSPKTRHVDFDDKYDEYEQVMVPFYVILDIRQRKRGISRELKGYRLTPDGYALLSPNAQGWLWLEPVAAWLGITDGAVVCYDRDGQPLVSYAALTKARRQAEIRAQEEARARAAAEARATELEARLRQLEEQQRRQQAKNQGE
ncbi:MAG: Uma2 family endonuclease [Caldilineaceae bacterium]